MNIEEAVESKYSATANCRNFGEQEIVKEIKSEIHSAFKFAEEAPFPSPEERFLGVFADE